MRNVFRSHSEVCHVWAQRSQERGEAGNIFFEGNSIYSYGYHYEIARFENNHVILNDTGYSSSTSKHIGHVLSAVSHYETFHVSNTFPNEILKDISDKWDKIQKSRKPDLYYQSDFLTRWNEYLTKFTAKEQKGLKADYKKELSKIRGLQKRLDNFYNSDNLKELVSKNLKKERSRKEAKIRQAQKEFNDQIKVFKRYERNDVNTWNRILPDVSNLAYLRISEDGTKVETSKGIRIDIDKARVLFKLIEAGRDVKGYKIDHYTVISMNGSLKVGCHTISKEEVFETGKKL